MMTEEEYREIEENDLMAQIESPGGRKDDSGKLPFHLLSPPWLFGVCQVLEFGRVKYEARNWEKGIVYSRCFSAAMRHLWAWWWGERHDPETGLNHLLHAACCLMFLYHFQITGRDHLDDSPGGPKRG